MSLPSAPGRYSQSDQNEVRRLIDEKFGRVFDRIRSLELAPPATEEPPPSPVTCGGGNYIWGSSSRNGVIGDLSDSGIRTTVFNAGLNEIDGYRFYAGLTSAGDLTTWRVDGQKRPIRGIGNGDNGSWWGGYCKPDYLIPGVTEWENNLADEYHGHMGLVTGTGNNLWIKNFSCNNVGDGVVIDSDPVPNVPGSADGWLIEGCALTGCHDDAVQNDTKHVGGVCDSFLEGMVLLAARPAATDTDAVNYDASEKLFSCTNSILWSRGHSFPDVTPRGGVAGDPAIFSWLKIQLNVGGNGGYARGISFALHDNVWRWDGVLSSETSDGRPLTSTDAAKIAEQSNNILLLPNQTSGFPPNWPTSLVPSFTPIYSSEAERYWDNVVSQWISDHPQVVLEDPGFFS